MKPQHRPQYKITRTEEFIRQSHSLRTRYKRVADLIKAIDWALERKPHYFTQIAGDYYLLKTGELSNPDLPQVKVIYRILEETNTIVLLSIDD